MANVTATTNLSAGTEITEAEKQYITQLKIIPGIVCRYCQAVGQHYSLQCDQSDAFEHKGQRQQEQYNNLDSDGTS